MRQAAKVAVRTPWLVASVVAVVALLTAFVTVSAQLGLVVAVPCLAVAAACGLFVRLHLANRPGAVAVLGHAIGSALWVMPRAVEAPQEPSSVQRPWLLGYDRRGRPVRFSLLREGHAILSGATGSGKSTGAYWLLAQAAVCPDLIVAGCDPSGLLLGPFWGKRHAEWQATGTTNLAAHVQLLERLVAEMDRRTRLLDEQCLDDLGWSVTPRLPAVLVVLEEYAGLVSMAKSMDAKTARDIERLVARLVAEGRKSAVRVLYLSQRADADVLGGFTRSNVGMAVTLRQSVEGVRMLHPGLSADEQAEVAAFPVGVALVRSAAFNGRVRLPYLGGYRQYRQAIEAASRMEAGQ